MTADQDAFGRRMKEERERRGITLETIVASTKIKRSLLEGLERNDVSRWPHGLFGRSYIRDYAGALGLPSDPIVAEFTRLFPELDATPLAHEPPAPVGVTSAAPAGAAGALRLTLAEEAEPLPVKTAWRLAAAADASAVVVGGAVIALITGVDLWTAVGVFALVYFPLSTAWIGRSFATLWFGGAS